MKIDPLIIICAGHGGSDRANRGPTGYVEADGVLDIALRLAELLSAAGYRFKLVRSKDETVALYDRSRKANEWQGDVYISLHTNAGVESAHGIETFYTLNNEWGNKHSPEAKRVAEIIQRELVKATGLRDRVIKTRLVDNPSSPIHGKDFYAVIRRSNMPSIITEMGFHTNRHEEGLLKAESFRKILAQALFDGVKEAYPIWSPIRAEERVIKYNLHGNPGEVNGLFFNGRNYPPIRFLEELGYQIGWDEKQQSVLINYRK